MKSTPHGFTIIELLVTITALALFLGLSLGFYTTFNEQKKLKNDTLEFVETLESAKQKIMSGDKPNPGCQLASVTVSYSNASQTYSMNAQCPTDVPIISNKTLSQNTNFTSTGSVTFKPLGAAATYTASCILLKNTTVNTCYQVAVEPVGTLTTKKNDTCVCQ